MQASRWFALALVVCVVGALGCGSGGGSGSSTSPTNTPIITTTSLTGILELPDTLNHPLLASIELASGVNPLVRNKLITTGTRQAFVNSSGIAYGVAIDKDTLAFHIDGVPEASSYQIDMRFGKLQWLAQTASSSGITVSGRSTAAALLAAKLRLTQPQRTATELLASYPAQITGLAQHIDTLFQSDPTFTPTYILATRSLDDLVGSLAVLIASNPIVVPGAQLAILNLGDNDLNGDGRADFRVERGNSGGSYHLQSLLDARVGQATGLVSNLSFISDAQLQQFTPDQGLISWILPAEVNIGFWCKLTLGRTADTFVRLWVKRVDSVDGVFYGMPVEYQFVTGAGTAVATGTKIFKKYGLTPGTGEVTLSNFLSDGAASDSQTLLYGVDGLRSQDQRTPLIRYREGVDTLSLSRATSYTTGADGYQTNMQAALTAVNSTNTMQVGQVFDVYFPSLGNYALLQIKAINTTNNTMTVDYKINRAYNDPSF